MSDTKNLHQFSRQVVEIMPVMLREFLKRENHELARGVISCSQMVALDYVSRHTSVKMSEISKVLSTKTSSASVLVDRLIRQGMLKRKHDEKDRRIVWISLTPKGKRVIDQILKQKRESIEVVFGRLSEKERTQYLKVLLKIKFYLDHQES